MAFRFDPRGDLPPPMILPTYHSRSSLSPYDLKRDHQRKSTPSTPETRPKRRPCYDWIFTTASNVHVAIDRSSFKTLTPFKSYVLAIADRRQVTVRGIGTVDLKIRCQPGSRESHHITLTNVLYVPDWKCNIFSDVYFSPANAYEHTWTAFGVTFMKKEDGSFTYWGFTEEFLGLEKLVLSRDLRGRSPMREDKDREVFSINVTWPQGQRDKWDELVAAEEARQQPPTAEDQDPTTEKSALMKLREIENSIRGGSLDLTASKRRGLDEISGNVAKRSPSARSSSLKAHTSTPGSFQSSAM